ncbi:MAG: hypothetical protein DHS20C02_11360 [Micavibrio sp.]|nr:MAG: hypothetical protein DHS20C02_11360 [Micavibrio sp.]
MAEIATDQEIIEYKKRINESRASLFKNSRAEKLPSGLYALKVDQNKDPFPDLDPDFYYTNLEHLKYIEGEVNKYAPLIEASNAIPGFKAADYTLTVDGQFSEKNAERLESFLRKVGSATGDKLSKIEGYDKFIRPANEANQINKRYRRTPTEDMKEFLRDYIPQDQKKADIIIDERAQSADDERMGFGFVQYAFQLQSAIAEFPELSSIVENAGIDDFRITGRMDQKTIKALEAIKDHYKAEPEDNPLNKSKDYGRYNFDKFHERYTAMEPADIETANLAINKHMQEFINLFDHMQEVDDWAYDWFHPAQLPKESQPVAVTGALGADSQTQMNLIHNFLLTKNNEELEEILSSASWYSSIVDTNDEEIERFLKQKNTFMVFAGITKGEDHASAVIALKKYINTHELNGQTPLKLDDNIKDSAFMAALPSLIHKRQTLLISELSNIELLDHFTMNGKKIEATGQWDDTEASEIQWDPELKGHATTKKNLEPVLELRNLLMALNDDDAKWVAEFTDPDYDWPTPATPLTPAFTAAEPTVLSDGGTVKKDAVKETKPVTPADPNLAAQTALAAERKKLDEERTALKEEIAEERKELDEERAELEATAEKDMEEEYLEQEPIEPTGDVLANKKRAVKEAQAHFMPELGTTGDDTLDSETTEKLEHYIRDLLANDPDAIALKDDLYSNERKVVIDERKGAFKFLDFGDQNIATWKLLDTLLHDREEKLGLWEKEFGGLQADWDENKDEYNTQRASKESEQKARLGLDILKGQEAEKQALVAEMHDSDSLNTLYQSSAYKNITRNKSDSDIAMIEEVLLAMWKLEIDYRLIPTEPSFGALPGANGASHTEYKAQVEELRIVRNAVGTLAGRIPGYTRAFEPDIVPEHPWLGYPVYNGLFPPQSYGVLSGNPPNRAAIHKLAEEALRRFVERAAEDGVAKELPDYSPTDPPEKGVMSVTRDGITKYYDTSNITAAMYGLYKNEAGETVHFKPDLRDLGLAFEGLPTSGVPIDTWPGYTHPAGLVETDHNWGPTTYPRSRAWAYMFTGLDELIEKDPANGNRLVYAMGKRLRGLDRDNPLFKKNTYEAALNDAQKHGREDELISAIKKLAHHNASVYSDARLGTYHEESPDNRSRIYNESLKRDYLPQRREMLYKRDHPKAGATEPDKVSALNENFKHAKDQTTEEDALTAQAKFQANVDDTGLTHDENQDLVETGPGIKLDPKATA